jgi:hypothetical protein
VQRGVAESQVGDGLEIDLLQRALHIFDVVAEARPQVPAGSVEHIGRAVDSDQAAARQSSQQMLGQSAAAAAQVERCLVTAQVERGDDGLAPGLHRVGQAVVGLGVPFSHGSFSVPKSGVSGSGVSGQGSAVSGHGRLIAES